jgi:methylenetetrahydrofolate--tRNA-(uracil-5-)-methyltransferase
MGLVAGRMAAAERLGRRVEAPPATTALGALVGHITGGHLGLAGGSFQPMNVNYGLFPHIDEMDFRGADGKRLKGADRTRAKKREMSLRALKDVDVWLNGQVAQPASA